MPSSGNIYVCEIDGCEKYAVTHLGHMSGSLVRMCNRHAIIFRNSDVPTQRRMIDGAGPPKWHTAGRRYG